MATKKVGTVVFGIRSRLGPGKIRRAVRAVLDQIKARHPRDFERIRQKVKEIRPLSMREHRKGTLGEWRVNPGGDSYPDFDSSGIITLASDMSHAIAVVAHEFGHACTRDEDFSRRDGADSEWVSEMCADYYAYKWGFGRLIARDRPHRLFSHHGPTPGQEFTMDHGMGDNVVHRYRVTRAFTIHLVQTETPAGRMIETAAQIKRQNRAQIAATESEWEKRCSKDLSQNGG